MHHPKVKKKSLNSCLLWFIYLSCFRDVDYEDILTFLQYNKTSWQFSFPADKIHLKHLKAILININHDLVTQENPHWDRIQVKRPRPRTLTLHFTLQLQRKLLLCTVYPHKRASKPEQMCVFFSGWWLKEVLPFWNCWQSWQGFMISGKRNCWKTDVM